MKKKLCCLSIVFFLLNCEAIFIEDISEETIELLAPSDNSEITRGSIQFNWQEVAASKDYTIQIATPNFENATQILLDSIITDNGFIKDLDSASYQWRVRGNNSGYSTEFSTHNLNVN